MSEGTIVVTLSELAQISLGNQNLKPFHMQTLLSLLGILVRKLNCQDEKLHIEGLECLQIKEIAEQKREIQALPFNDSYLLNYWDLFKRIDKVAIRINDCGNKLDQHFKDVVERNFRYSNEFNYHYWEKYASIDEDLFELMDDPAPKIIAHSDFMMKVKRRICLPIERKMMQIENYLVSLIEKFQQFDQQINGEAQKLDIIPAMIGQIYNLNEQQKEYQKQLALAIEEVRAEIRIKLDKRHLPVMRKYYIERIERILEAIEELKHRQPESVLFATGSSNVCLSCLSWLPGSPEYGLPSPFASPPFKFQATSNFPPDCKCRLLSSDSATPVPGYRIENAQTESIRELIRNSECNKSTRHICKGEFAMKRCSRIIQLIDKNDRIPLKKSPKIQTKRTPRGLSGDTDCFYNTKRDFICPHDDSGRHTSRAVSTPLCGVKDTPRYCGSNCMLRHYQSILCLKTVRSHSDAKKDDFVLPEYMRNYSGLATRTCKVGRALSQVDEVCADTKGCIRRRIEP